ncbi:MAG: Iron-uptake system permease protein FeuC [Candidatus Erwinia impunctatus]|nr:Iron-uptake system permease protein FeuC [Culicoides impunctatus]
MKHSRLPRGYRYWRFGLFSRLYQPGIITALLFSVLFTAALALISVTQGSLTVPVSSLARTLLFEPVLTGGEQYVVYELRLPRIIMALFCGAMLGVAGATMQSLTRNGLADPGLIGVKEGACVMVLIVIFAFPALGLFWRPLAGMAGGLLAAGIVLILARDVSRPRFVLLGIGVAWTFSAGMSLFMTTADIRDVQTAMIWLAGSLQAASWPLIGVTLCWALPAFGLLIFTTHAANAAQAGYQTAISLGVNLVRLQSMRLMATVLLTATSVSCVGRIGFIGLIAPHMTRFLFRSGERTLLWGSAIIGSVLLLLADTLGRVLLTPLQLPAGIAISLIGGPFFLWLLWRRRDQL